MNKRMLRLISGLLCLCLLGSGAGVAYGQEESVAEVIYLTAADEGVGLYTEQENGAIKAERDADFYGAQVYRAADEALVVVSVGENMFQVVDEYSVTGANVEEVISARQLSAVLAEDLRSAAESWPAVTVLLPGRVNASQTACYSYDGEQLAKTIYKISPAANPRPLIAEPKRGLERVFSAPAMRRFLNVTGLSGWGNVIVPKLRTWLENFVVVVKSDGDYMLVRCYESKTRTYIAVNDQIRVKQDVGQVDYLVEFGHIGRLVGTYRPCADFGIVREDDFLNAQAISHMDGKKAAAMYVEIVPEFSFDQEMVFPSQLAQ